MFAFRLQLFCTKIECEWSTVYPKCVATHLLAEHQLSSTIVEEKVALAQANTMHNTWVGEDFSGEIYIVFLDLETTRLIQFDQPIPKIVEIAAKVLD